MKGDPVAWSQAAWRFTIGAGASYSGSAIPAWIHLPVMMPTTDPIRTHAANTHRTIVMPSSPFTVEETDAIRQKASH
jgi:hypothetical protein